MRHFLALFLIACGAGPTVAPGPSADPTATPTEAVEVRNTLPADGDSDIAITTLITVVFGTAMDAESINEKTIHLSDGTPGMVTWRGGRTATLLPKGGLKKGTTYTVVISADVKTESGARLGSDRTFSFTTVEGEHDASAPTIVSTTPAAAASASIHTTISATFSEDVDPASVTAASFFVGAVKGLISVSGKTVTFTPSAPLAFATSYKATLTTAIKDKAGNALAGKHEWLFTTEAEPDTTAPLLQTITPANGAVDVALDQEITLTFSEALKASTVSGTSVRLEDELGAVAASRMVAGATITIVPSALVYGKTYTVIVTAAVQDAAGNAVTAFSRSFTTLAPPDTQAPTLISTTPVDAATAVDASSIVSFTLSEALAAVSAANVTFKDAALADVAFSVSSAGETVTVTPDAPLAAATSYTVTLSGVTDLAGNPLAAPVSVTFTTN